MGLRPFFGYFGGKWRAAPKYPAPAHPEIVEPFAGSAGYALRYHTRRVSLYDKDPMIVGLWSYLIRARASEILSLPDVPAEGVDALHLACEEQRWLIGFWLTRGAVGPNRTASAWARSGQYADQFWGQHVRERLAAQVEQIRHWTVALASYEQIPNRPASWFIDPPYVGAGIHYRCSSREIDFSHLGAWCVDRQGQVVVCESEGATWLPFTTLGVFKVMEGINRKRKRPYVEVVAYFPG